MKQKRVVSDSARLLCVDALLHTGNVKKAKEEVATVLEHAVAPSLRTAALERLVQCRTAVRRSSTPARTF